MKLMPVVQMLAIIAANEVEVPSNRLRPVPKAHTAPSGGGRGARRRRAANRAYVKISGAKFWTPDGLPHVTMDKALDHMENTRSLDKDLDQ